MKKPTSPRTMDDFLNELTERNQSLAAWARERGFSLEETYSVTRGRTKGKRGKARDILIAMGLTPPPMFRSHVSS